MLRNVGPPAPFIRALLDADHVWLKALIFEDCGLEGVQMFLRPDDFETCTI